MLSNDVNSFYYSNIEGAVNQKTKSNQYLVQPPFVFKPASVGLKVHLDSVLRYLAGRLFQAFQRTCQIGFSLSWFFLSPHVIQNYTWFLVSLYTSLFKKRLFENIKYDIIYWRLHSTVLVSDWWNTGICELIKLLINLSILNKINFRLIIVLMGFWAFISKSTNVHSIKGYKAKCCFQKYPTVR